LEVKFGGATDSILQSSEAVVLQYIMCEMMSHAGQHAKQSRREIGGKFLRILDFCGRLRWLVKLTLPPLWRGRSLQELAECTSDSISPNPVTKEKLFLHW
jgi:hypothetical protein